MELPETQEEYDQAVAAARRQTRVIVRAVTWLGILVMVAGVGVASFPIEKLFAS